MNLSYKITKSELKGEIVVPPSKSHTLRAILFALMADGKSVIHNYLDSPDTWAMVEACRHFGAVIEVYPDHLEVEGVKGKIEKIEDVIQAGNSGLVLRFCSAMGALSSQPMVVTGDYSIRHIRPMKELLSGLSQLGASARSMRRDDYAPILIEGPLKPGTAYVRGVDSQPISALLIAASFMKGKTELFVEQPEEKPWIEMTLSWFDKLGIKYFNDNFTHYTLEGNAAYSGFNYSVPGDFSSAAFSIGAALITNSEIVVKNLDFRDVQGDKKLIDVLRAMGALIEENSNGDLHVKKSPKLKGMAIDVNDFIDAVPVLASIACFSEGITTLKRASSAKFKECNRLETCLKELAKMGGKIQETEDGLIIEGTSLAGGQVHSHHDHRMGMALTIAGMGAKGETFIEGMQCIKKTYPTFLDDFNALGACIKAL